MKAIELVRKAASLGASLARPVRDGEGTSMGRAGRALALGIVRGTTVAARQMQSLPIPKPKPAERIALSVAATQLRTLADLTASVSPPGGDPEVEAALGALVAETLALVDKVLAGEPELAARRAVPVLPASTDDETPKKIRF